MCLGAQDRDLQPHHDVVAAAVVVDLQLQRQEISICCCCCNSSSNNNNHPSSLSEQQQHRVRDPVSLSTTAALKSARVWLCSNNPFFSLSVHLFCCAYSSSSSSFWGHYRIRDRFVIFFGSLSCPPISIQMLLLRRGNVFSLWSDGGD